MDAISNRKYHVQFAESKFYRITVSVAALFAFTCSPASAQWTYRGMALDLEPTSNLQNESILDLQQIGTNTVAIDFPLTQTSAADQTIVAPAAGSLPASFSQLESVINNIHETGMDVFLRPRITNVRPTTIVPSDPPNWFEQYGTILSGIADFAEDKKVAMLSVGSELNALESEEYETNWRGLVADVRDRYSGEITYASTHFIDDETDGGFELLPWWDAVDAIGINAYFPLTFDTGAVADTLRSGWQGVASDIEAWRDDAGLSQKVVFTEVGYRSADGAATQPFSIEEFEGQFSIDLDEQANSYDALLHTMQDKDWWDGVFWQGWQSNSLAGGADEISYTPQQKPAEQVVAEAFGGRTTFVDRPSLLASWESEFESWHTPGESITATGDLMLDEETGITNGVSSLLMPSGSSLEASKIWTFQGSDEYSLIRLATADTNQYQFEFDATFDHDQVPENGETAMVVVLEDDRQQPVRVEIPVNLTADDGLETVRVTVPFTEFETLKDQSLFYELDLGTENSWTGEVWLDNLRITTTVAGDLNVDAIVDCHDIDALSHFVRNGPSNQQYDVNGDGVVNSDDRESWFHTSNILPGDLDMNGSAEFADFLTLSGNFGQSRNYCEGDITGDRNVAFADFLILSANFGRTNVGARQVPEPTYPAWIVVVFISILRRRR